MTFMTWRRGAGVSRALATLVATILLLSADICEKAQDGIIQECRYSLSSNWPSGEHSFDPGNQASCPIKTPPGGRNQNYNANAVMVPGTTGGSGSLHFVDFHGNTVSESGSVLYSCCDVYVFIGHYTAGTIAAPSGTIAYDQAINTLVLSPSGVGTVTANLGYQTTVAAAVLGSSAVDPGQSTTLTGEYYQSDLVPPINYQWYKNGSPISGQTGANLVVNAGSPNTRSTYLFSVTDSQSRTISASHDVLTTAGCGTRFVC